MPERSSAFNRFQAAFTHWEPSIHAFTAVSNDITHSGDGLLSGLSVGVKDIIDVVGLPTHNGSAACADVGAAVQDATVVACLRGAGAFIAGKTVSTEFAFTDPSNCRNPHDLNLSPGVSSSGSGAAVAAGIVDIALLVRKRQGRYAVPQPTVVLLDLSRLSEFCRPWASHRWRVVLTLLGISAELSNGPPKRFA